MRYINPIIIIIIITLSPLYTTNILWSRDLFLSYEFFV